MIILIANDDGIRSDGIIALADALAPLGDVVVVAPDRERSAASHSLTLHRPLRVEEVAPHRFMVDGTPTDCVTLGVNALLPRKPDLIASGINMGGNMGTDITYSGTVSAASEGALLGIPSFAISVVGRSRFDFRAAGRVARALASQILDHGLPPETLLNVNVPNVAPGQIRGIRITRQGKRLFHDIIVEKTDPRGRKYYWIGGHELGFEEMTGSDYEAVSHQYVSVTPLHLDYTNHDCIRTLLGWEFDLAALREEGGP